MAFERLDIIVERLVGRIVDTGEDATAIASLRPRKNAEAEAPASGQVSYLPANKGHANRSMITASPTRRPSSAVVIDLSVYREQRRHHATPF